MRFAFFFSGVGGFALVFLVGLSAERQFDLLLRDAAVACLFAAYVGRWFWRVLETAFAETLAARRAAAEAAEAAAEAAAANPAAPAAATTPPLATTPPVPPAAPARAASVSAKTAPVAPALAGAGGPRR